MKNESGHILITLALSLLFKGLLFSFSTFSVLFEGVFICFFAELIYLELSINC